MTAADQTPAERCGECRLGLGVHTPSDPYCDHHQTPATDSPKMIRETLCTAQSAVLGLRSEDPRTPEHAARLQRLIDEVDGQRPLGPDGKHGNRHTPTCGCEDTPATDTEPLRRDDWERRYRTANEEANSLAVRVVTAEDEVTRLTALLAEQAATIERVRAVHVRRVWDYDRDPVTRFKHQKFLDQCDHCRVNWPCRTATALGSQRTEGQG